MFSYNDNNHILPEHAQGVGGKVQIKKVLKVERVGGSHRATLFVYLGQRAVSKVIGVHVNGKKVGTIACGNVACEGFRWHQVEVPPKRLRAGNNQIVLTCDSQNMPAWRVGVAITDEPGGSFVSKDGGRTWSNRRLGQFAAITGEYLIRLRVYDGSTTRRPRFVSEQPESLRLRQLRAELPEDIRECRCDTFSRLRKLSSYLAKTLVYFNAGQAIRYCPWDYRHIMQANADNKAMIRRRKQPENIVMCVHFAAAFAQAALSLGAKVRCMVSTWDIHSPNGHFFPEVWLEDLGRWVVIDPTGDFAFINDNGEPIGSEMLYQNRRKLSKWIDFGPGWASHRSKKLKIVEDWVISGKVYRNLGYWRRNDFLSHPEYAATSHGAVTYCEPDIVWIAGDDPCLEAFPYDCRD